MKYEKQLPPLWWFRLLYGVPRQTNYPGPLQGRFGFLVHPTVESYREWAALASDYKPKLAPLINACPFLAYWFMLLFWPTSKLRYDDMTVVTPTGRAASGVIWTVPMMARHLASRNVFLRWQAMRRIMQAVHHCAIFGARYVGLGAFTAIAGKEGKGVDVTWLTEVLQIPVFITTGNGYTAVAAADEAARALYEVCDKTPDMYTKSCMVIGAHGSVGMALTNYLARALGFRKFVLVTRPARKPGVQRENPITTLMRDCPGTSGSYIENMELVFRNVSQEQYPGLVFCATSATREDAIQLNWLTGAIIVDCSRPRTVSAAMHSMNLVIDGGMISVGTCSYTHGKGEKAIGQVLPGCMAETIALALAGESGHYSIGKLDITQVMYLSELGKVLGYVSAGPRHNDRSRPDAYAEFRGRLEQVAEERKFHESADNF
jgi:predicted amino acid dehydrogenase